MRLVLCVIILHIGQIFKLRKGYDRVALIPLIFLCFVGVDLEDIWLSVLQSSRELYYISLRLLSLVRHLLVVCG